MGSPPSLKTIERFGQAEREEIAREYADGERTEEIGKRHGTGNNTIRFLLKHMGVPMRKLGETNRKDITGKRFGRLVAIRPTGQNIKGQGREWEFRCDCGNLTHVSATAVIKGNTTSCGCYAAELLAREQRHDLTGEKIGSLTAIRFSHNIVKKNGNKGSAYWLWRCECGNELTATGSGVRSRFKKKGAVSCPKCAGKRRGLLSSDDYTGKRFGMLVGLRQLDEAKSPAQARWLWQCDCGKQCTRLPGNVKDRGDQANCGCSNQDRSADRTGERFGLLVALEKIGKRPGENTYMWLFQCDCGNVCEARLRDAVSGLQRSCGCRQGGIDSINSWISGEFRNPEAPAFFYVFPMARFPGYTKPGIAEDLDERKRVSRGEYGEIHDYLEVPRLDAWLIEQVVLKETLSAANCPRELMEIKWEGYSEVRWLAPDVLFAKALEAHAMWQELGRVEFAIRYLPTTPRERLALRALKSADAEAAAEGSPSD